jgi:hypothetical protein
MASQNNPFCFVTQGRRRTICMLDVATTVGTIGSAIVSLVALGSVVYQRRQTQIMEAGLERAANEDLDAPEIGTGTAMEKKLRMVINKRLSENRAKMKQDFATQLERIERMLDEEHIKEYSNYITGLIQLLDDQKVIKDLAGDVTKMHAEVITSEERVLAETGRYSADIAAHGHELEGLQQQIENMQNGIRTQIRTIAQQLLQMTSQG